MFLPPGSEGARAGGRTGDWPLALRRAAPHRGASAPFAGCLTARFRGCAAWHGAMAAWTIRCRKAEVVVDARPRPGAVSDSGPVAVLRWYVDRSDLGTREMKTPARRSCFFDFGFADFGDYSYVVSVGVTLHAGFSPDQSDCTGHRHRTVYTDLPRDLRRRSARCRTSSVDHTRCTTVLPESPHRHVREP